MGGRLGADDHRRHPARIIAADAAIGVITTASFALGLALFALFGRRGANFDSALFGSILGVDTADVVGVAIVTVIAGLVVFFGYRTLLFTTFDPEVAAASGVRTAVVDAVLMVILAASILATMQVLGVTLVAASVVIPPSVARLLTTSFSRMLWLSTGIGAAAGFIGMNVSYHLDVQSAGHRAGRRQRVRGGDGGRQRADALPPRPRLTGTDRLSAVRARRAGG